MFDRNKAGDQPQHLSRPSLRLEQNLFVGNELLGGGCDRPLTDDRHLGNLEDLSVRVVCQHLPCAQYGGENREGQPQANTPHLAYTSPLPVVVIVSLPCLTPLTLTNASATSLISEAFPLTTSTSRQ